MWSILLVWIADIYYIEKAKVQRFTCINEHIVADIYMPCLYIDNIRYCGHGCAVPFNFSESIKFIYLPITITLSGVIEDEETEGIVCKILLEGLFHSSVLYVQKKLY